MGNQNRGTLAAVIGGIAGLIPAIVLASYWLLTQKPDIAEQRTGYLALALLFLTPYLLALIASRVRDPGVRGGLLIGVGLLSLVASVSTLSSLVFFFLPATLVIWFSAVRSLTAAERLLVTVAPATVAGLVVAGLLGFGFFALLWMEDEEPEVRCWALTRGDDLRVRWESRPNIGGPEGMGVSGSGVDQRAICTSSMITDSEAWVTIAAVALALLGMAIVSQWPEHPRQHKVPNSLK